MATRLAPPIFVILWATGFIGARYAMPWAEPFSFLAVRFALSAALIFMIVLLLRAPRLSPASAAHAAFAGVLMHGGYLGGIFWAINAGMPAGLAALIVGLQPLLTAIMAGPALGEKVVSQHWIGLVVGFAGTTIVIAPKLGLLGTGVNMATLTATFIAVLAMTAGTVWQKRFLDDAPLATGTFWQYVGGAAFTGVLALTLENQDYTITGELIFALIWLTFVLSIGAIFLLMFMIREGAVSKVASLFYLVPPCTALFAWALFGETLSAVQIVGMGIACVGVALAMRPAKQPPGAPPGSA